MPDAGNLFEAVSYQAPKGQSHIKVRGMPVRAAWAHMQGFLETWTEATLLDHAIGLTVEDTMWVPADICDVCIGEAQALFGLGTPPDPQTRGWTLPPDRLADAIEFAMSDVRWPRQKIGPIRLHFAYRFNWRKWRDGLPPPLSTWRHGISSIGFCFTGRALAVSPGFTFPVPYESEEFRRFLADLRAALPFDLKPNHFSRMLVNTRSGGIRHRRLSGV